MYKEKPAAEPEKVVRLKLENNGGGGVDVVAVDEYGKKFSTGHLLQFNSDGTAWRYTVIGESIGLPLDSQGRVIIIN